MKNPKISYPSQGFLIKLNALKGKLGQMICVSEYLSEGYSIIPTGQGSDYFVVRIPPEVTTKLHGILVESKTGNSRLTKQQRKVKKFSKNSNIDYRIYRISDSYLKNFIENLMGLIPYLDSKNKKEKVI